MLKTLAFIGLVSTAAAQSSGEGCLSPEQARNSVRELQLIDMPEAAQLARSRAGGDLVSANLCRVNQRFVYVVAILAKDGRVTRVAVDAKTRLVSDHR